MAPDLDKRVPREILDELIEDGTEAFLEVFEKLFNLPMRLERSDYLQAEPYQRTRRLLLHFLRRTATRSSLAIKQWL